MGRQTIISIMTQTVISLIDDSFFNRYIAIPILWSLEFSK